MKVRIVLNKLRIPLTARISKITVKGLMTIEFSEPIAKPQNYTLFNNQFLRIRVIPSEDTRPDQNKSLIDWKIVAFRKSEMDI